MTTIIPASIPIGVPPSTRLLRIVREHDGWILWITANRTLTAGTYYKLHNDGSLTLHRADEQGFEELIHTAKGPDT